MLIQLSRIQRLKERREERENTAPANENVRRRAAFKLRPLVFVSQLNGVKPTTEVIALRTCPSLADGVYHIRKSWPSPKRNRAGNTLLQSMARKHALRGGRGLHSRGV